jgi:putative membrane protein
VESPVVGREANLDAALKLGMADPEDSDVNTIFGGIKLLDELIASGKSAEIVSLAGDLKVGLASDSKLSSQLDSMLAMLHPNGVIVVSDGAEDEAILPIIHSRIKVDGVRRILVKQSPNLESTYYLLKQVFTDPKISHTVFIPPALALLMFAIFSLLGYPNGAVVAITGAVGLYLLFRGLGLDDSMEEAKQTLRKSLYAGKIAFITYILAAMLVIIATVRGFAYSWQYYHEPVSPGFFILVMIYLHESIWWYVVAALCINLGKVMDMYLEGIRDARSISYIFFPPGHRACDLVCHRIHTGQQCRSEIRHRHGGVGSVSGHIGHCGHTHHRGGGKPLQAPGRREYHSEHQIIAKR